MSAVSRHEARRIVAPPGLPRLLGGVRGDSRPVDLAAHVLRHGRPPAVRGRQSRSALIGAVAASGLRGRGGAGFPVARKLEAVAAQRGRPIVVANGAEGEPPSSKDRTLLAYVPHLVLDGAAVAAAALGADEVIVAVGSRSHDVVARAIAERRHYRADQAGFSLVPVPDTFVAGEETALVNLIDNGRAVPTFTPPRPFEAGVRGAPTLVQNVETLANLALIARFGPAWFRTLGTAEEPGSALVSLSGAVARPGVYEIALGMPLSELVAQAGGFTERVDAVLTGGYFGAWLPATAALAAPLSDAGLAPLGGALGARTLVALPAASCGLLETARVARYLAAESAGQCGPCVHGLAAVATDLVRIARGDDGAEALRRLERRLLQLEGRGACRHPDGAVRLIASALRVFRAEVELHAAHGRCSALTKRPLLPMPVQRAGTAR
jgi:NADH:ubiquinone oxidoreductase subunit F (NADH-binding)